MPHFASTHHQPGAGRDRKLVPARFNLETLLDMFKRLPLDDDNSSIRFLLAAALASPASSPPPFGLLFVASSAASSSGIGRSRQESRTKAQRLRIHRGQSLSRMYKVPMRVNTQQQHVRFPCVDLFEYNSNNTSPSLP